MLKPLRTLKAILSGAVWLCAFCTAASAQGITIPAENLKKALDDYIKQSGVQLIYNVDDVAGVTSRGVRGVSTAQALDRLLSGTGMVANRDKSGAVIISRAAARHAEAVLDTQPSESGRGDRNPHPGRHAVFAAGHDSHRP